MPSGCSPEQVRWLVRWLDSTACRAEPIRYRFGVGLAVTYTIAMTCFFNACTNPRLPNGTQCAFHKSRRPCIEPGCHNQVFARSRCVRHGGKRRCSVSECTANARLHGVCSRHGAARGKPNCSTDNCASIAHRNGKCIRHGGGRPCHFPDCKTHARSGGYCWRHRPATPYAFPANKTLHVGLSAVKEELLDASILDAVLATMDAVEPFAWLLQV
ncbi:hypothetical protein SDRG_02887 [Saprolegnia diclina VS20]|uniref:Uncharacterized protein n=1 Tax=Saprolegnia diclina (strain VS20) TaxID=1156394 RepID=T0QQ30_SAPDV|nr:hypothetical protein SDRG_02887 [Saprolegnia diclina VS20]EQC40239.1 hypothetical protein SDRG_02887 [Saprolegnia diclina VS20]|eukprot:XP_008606713.1 hypothetical protein SDRG_02887 [Saprolegnia diclina VS20]